MERINARKKNKINIVQCLNVTDKLIIPMIFIFLSFREKAPHDKKEFSRENSKPRRVSRESHVKLNPHQVYFKPCHSQNSLSKHYSAIFKHIQNLVKHWHMQKPGIFGILEYSEPFYNCILTYI